MKQITFDIDDSGLGEVLNWDHVSENPLPLMHNGKTIGLIELSTKDGKTIKGATTELNIVDVEVLKKLNQSGLISFGIGGTITKMDGNTITDFKIQEVSIQISKQPK